MRTVKVNKLSLIDKLQTNLESHRTLYLEAADGYRERVIEEFERLLKEAREGGEIRTYVQLEAPHDHTREYENAIAMMEMSVDQEIELEHHEFQQYVLDQWDWSERALTANSVYAGKSLPARRRA